MQTYRVQSKSSPDLNHQVVDGETFWSCDCAAFVFRHGECSHIKLVKEHQQAQKIANLSLKNHENISA